MLRLGPDQEAQADLLDEAGAFRATLGLWPIDGRPELAPFSREGKRRGQLWLGGSEQPELTLLDPQENPRATLGLPPDGHPKLEMLDAAGNPRVKVNLQPDGSPELLLSGGD